MSTINKVFTNTQNSYKYYWWLSIVEICQEENKNQIFFDEIILKIISKLWYPVNYFKLSFGKIDKCSTYIKQIQDEYKVKDNINKQELFQLLYDKKETNFLRNITSELIRYVPYRFIRPWYAEETRGLKDALVNSEIIRLQNESAPYKIDIKLNKIIVDEKWFRWINSNYSIIKAFTYFELLKYLEKENPNVRNLSSKLEKPNSRKLNPQTKYWKKYIIKNPLSQDVFQSINFSEIESLSIDHFLPWSYFGHDLIWNLHPVDKDVNSSKNNFLPSKVYCLDFYKLQFNFSKFLCQENLIEPLESYFIFFNSSKEEFTKMPSEKFIKKMNEFYQSEFEKAKTMGFSENWNN